MIRVTRYALRMRAAPIGALLVLGIVLAGLSPLWIVASRRAAAATIQSRVTSQLVVRGHHQVVDAMLDRGMRIHGVLYPALPGVNAVDVTLKGAARTTDVAGPGTLELEALMPGMAMRPARATLRGRDGRYRGNLALPMFGTYVARVVLATPRGRWRGPMYLTVPLTLSP